MQGDCAAVFGGEVGRTRLWSYPSSSQTSTTPSSAALHCEACCSPPDHESPPPSFICSSVLHVHQLPANVLCIRTLRGARFAIRIVWQLYITVLQRSIYTVVTYCTISEVFT